MNCADAAALTPLYLSGELDESRAHEFGKHMQSCADCAREVSLQMALDARVRAAVLSDTVDSRAIEARVLQSIDAGSVPRPSAWRWGMAAAAVLAVGVIGFAGYRAMLAPQATGVFAAAARDHYAEIVDRQPRRWRTDLASVNELAVREGLSLAVIPAMAPAGYHFQRAKLCRLDGAIYLHLVYSDAAGSRNLSIFLDGQDQSHLAKVNAASLGAEHVAGFEDGHVRAVIVTDQSGDAALQFARLAASVI